MKVALILPAELKMAPYVQYYTSLLERKSCDYRIITWNRSGSFKSKNDEKIIVYDKKSPENLNGISKLIDYCGFVSYVKRELTEHKYDYVILHTIIPVAFLSIFLKKKYFKKYIIDIRDICSLYGVMKYGLNIALKNSMLNVISSPGFKQWLPDASYLISHNIGHEWEKKMQINKRISFKTPIRILTIGFIRYYDVNKKLIDYCANRVDVQLIFAGKGEVGVQLNNYVKTHAITNVTFTGEYIKKNEDSLVDTADFVSILLPLKSVVPQAIANRFYLAILNCKPLIVNKGGIQADYIEKYGLGIAIGENDDLMTLLNEYITNFNEELYLKNRRLFLEEILCDINSFQTAILKNIK